MCSFSGVLSFPTHSSLFQTSKAESGCCLPACKSVLCSPVAKELQLILQTKSPGIWFLFPFGWLFQPGETEECRVPHLNSRRGVSCGEEFHPTAEGVGLWGTARRGWQLIPQETQVAITKPHVTQLSQHHKSTLPSWDRGAWGSFISPLDYMSMCCVHAPPAWKCTPMLVCIGAVLHACPWIPISSPWLHVPVWNGWAKWKQTHVDLKRDCGMDRKCFLLPVDLN